MDALPQVTPRVHQLDALRGVAVLMILFANIFAFGYPLEVAEQAGLSESMSLLPQLQHQDVRARTMQSMMVRYYIDQQHAERVADMAATLADQLHQQWNLASFEGLAMLRSGALLHELGLLIEYKNHHHHGAYIISHAELPGFTRAQQQLVMALVHNHRAEIMPEVLARQTMTSVMLAGRLTRILRLAVILSMRRRHEALPQVRLSVHNECLNLSLPAGWLEQHPLMRAELEQEVQYQQQAGWVLTIN